MAHHAGHSHHAVKPHPVAVRKIPVAQPADDVQLMRQALTTPDTRSLNPAAVMQLQRRYGNRFVSRLVSHRANALSPLKAIGTPTLLQRKKGKKKIKFVRRKLSNGERLLVRASLSKPDRQAQVDEAEEIIKRLNDTYGITLSSKASAGAILDSYGGPSKKSVNKDTRPWRLRELHALEGALVYYAPLLGKERAKSSQRDSDQGVTTFGAMNKGVSDDNDGAGPYFETNTLAETFTSNKNIAMFTAGLTYDKDFKGDDEKSLRGIIVHELAHGLIEGYAIDDFVRIFRDYWVDTETRVSGKSKTGKKGSEAPITKYGGDSAGEDLGETAMFYFEAPDRLSGGNTDINPKKKAGRPGNPAPRRKAFMDGVVADWKEAPEIAAFRQKCRVVMSIPASKNKRDRRIVEKALKELQEAYKLLTPGKQKAFKEELTKAQIHYTQFLPKPKPAKAKAGA